MTATIIQTNNEPLQSIDVDGVTVDLIENALRNAREEMEAPVRRTLPHGLFRSVSSTTFFSVIVPTPTPSGGALIVHTRSRLPCVSMGWCLIGAIIEGPPK